MVTNYLFVHIPKTAGTSFRAGLTKALGEDAVGSFLFSPRRLSQADVNRLDHHRAVVGHFSIEDAALFRKRYLLTIVRDPVNRCLSWYYYAHNHPSSRQLPDWRAAQECTVRDFFFLDQAIIFRNIFNRQVRQLGGHVLDSEINLRVALSRAKKTIRDAVCTKARAISMPIPIAPSVALARYGLPINGCSRMRAVRGSTSSSPKRSIGCRATRRMSPDCSSG